MYNNNNSSNVNITNHSTTINKEDNTTLVTSGGDSENDNTGTTGTATTLLSNGILNVGVNIKFGANDDSDDENGDQEDHIREYQGEWSLAGGAVAQQLDSSNNKSTTGIPLIFTVMKDLVAQRQSSTMCLFL